MGRLDQIRFAVELLSEAAAAGLLVSQCDGQLLIKGPRKAEALAKQVLRHKWLLLPLLEDRHFEIVKCFDEGCPERVLLVDGEGFCRAHSMTINTKTVH